MANELGLTADPLFGSRELEMNAAFILRSGELQAAKTLALYSTIGQGLQSIGQTVAQMYETRNRTAVEMWKLEEGQRQFNQEFTLKREQATLDGELKKIEIENTRLNTLITNQNAEIQRAQLAGDRTLMPMGAQVTADMQTDVARGLLGKAALDIASRATMKSQIDGSDIPVISDKFLTFKSRDLPTAMARPLSDEYNSKGMTVSEAMGIISSPNNPDRMEALRLISTHSSPEAFRQLAANHGVAPGSVEWTRLESYIADPTHELQANNLRKLQIARSLADTPEAQAKLDTTIANLQSAIAGAEQKISSVNPSSIRSSVMEAIKENPEGYDKKLETATKDWMGRLIDFGKGTGSSALIGMGGNPLLAVLKQTYPRMRDMTEIVHKKRSVAELDAMGQLAVKNYLENGDPASRHVIERVAADIDAISRYHGGPAVDQQFWRDAFVTKWLPSGIPAPVHGLGADDMGYNRRLRELFTINPATLPSTSTVQTVSTIGLSKDTPFDSLSTAQSAGLPSGTIVYYKKSDGQTYSAPLP